MKSNYRKPWRWPRTKIKHLVILGVSLKEDQDRRELERVLRYVAYPDYAKGDVE